MENLMLRAFAIALGFIGAAGAAGAQQLHQSAPISNIVYEITADSAAEIIERRRV